MDLAIELGAGSFESLGRTMTEREFKAWDAYRTKRKLPARRLELMLAQLTQVVASAMGGSNQPLSYYLELIDPSEDEEDGEQLEPEEALEAAKEAFGFNPRSK